MLKVPNMSTGGAPTLDLCILHMQEPPVQWGGGDLPSFIEFFHPISS